MSLTIILCRYERRGGKKKFLEKEKRGRGGEGAIAIVESSVSNFSSNAC